MLRDEASLEKVKDLSVGGTHRVTVEKSSGGVDELMAVAQDEAAAGCVKIELTPCEGGSDSGVEMSGKYCRCRSANAGHNGFAGAGDCGDSESDCFTAGGGGGSNGHSPMYYGMDMCDLISSTRKLSIGDSVDANGEHSLASYDAASENGSESSSVDDSKKGKSECAAIVSNKAGSAYCAKNAHRYANPSSALGRARTPFGHDSLKLVSRTSTKEATDVDAKTRLSGGEGRGHSVRSCSMNRARTPLSPEEAKWADGGRSASRNRAPPAGGGAVMEKISTYEAYATMPRRRQKDCSHNALETRNAPREPSLNRAASLRKKFLENSLMTTSFNGSFTSPSQSVKTMPPYVKPKPAAPSPSVKTKIYHEIWTQTLLTNSDVDRTLAEHPFEIFKNFNLEADSEYRVKKRYEEQLTSISEELKKIKKENSKQRTVIEWLEGELSASKDEKFILQNKLTSIEQRIYSLLRHKGSNEDVLHQLEREVSYNNNVVNQLQEEINDLQQMCCILKEDLNKSYSVQKTIIEAQKASEMESMELQEFLQAEKSTLSDSLRDMELELKTCMSRLNETEHELAEKKEEFSNLQSKYDQQREENEATKERLTNLERRCRELLLYQGAAISSASVALSGLSSRFEQLLDQLYTLYSISDTDLQNDTFLMLNLGDEKVEDPVDIQIDASRLNLTRTWLKAVSNIITKTSAEIHDVNSEELTSATHGVCTDLRKENGVNSRPKRSREPGYDDVNKRNSVLNLITTDDALYSPKPEFDSRRNSILPDLYAGVDNLTADFGVCDLLNDSPEALTSRIKDKLNGISFLRDCNGQDVSLVEQINEIDTLVTKVFKVILLTQSNYFSERKIITSEEDYVNRKVGESVSDNMTIQSSAKSKIEEIDFQNGSLVPNGKNSNSNTLPYIELQNKAINNALSKLHQMQEIVDESTYLKKIQTELQTVSEKCNSFLSELNN